MCSGEYMALTEQYVAAVNWHLSPVAAALVDKCQLQLNAMFEFTSLLRPMRLSGNLISI